jgi:hypothetical protein
VSHSTLERIAALLGGPVALGHHRHAFAAAVQRHAQHGFHAGHGAGCGVVKRLDLAGKHRRMRHHRRQHAGQAHVDAVALVAGGFGARIEPARGLADDAELFRVLERDGLRHRQLHRRFGQLAIGQALAAGAYHHALLGAQAARVNTPLRSGRRDQHGAGARAELTVLRVGVFDRARAAREVHAESRVHIGRVGRAVLAFDQGPVRIQLFGQDHRQAGLHALPELEPVDGDGHRAVAVDAHKG